MSKKAVQVQSLGARVLVRPRVDHLIMNADDILAIIKD